MTEIDSDTTLENIFVKMRKSSEDFASQDGNDALLIGRVTRASISEEVMETPHSPNENPDAESSSTCDDGVESSKPGNRKSRKREKQRARRSLKRQQQKQQQLATVESVNNQDNMTGETAEGQAKRHRPTQVERSMLFFMTMSDWSRLFLGSEAWLPRLNTSGKLDPKTAEAISKVVKQSWISSGGPSGFRSLEELERLVEFKHKELSYIEKQLKRMPSLQEEAWKSYVGDLERLSQQESVEEMLEGPAEFLRDTIVPCLAAQVSSLRARTKEVRVLRDKYERLCQKWNGQEEIRSLISSLRISQGLVLPVCPVWREIQHEIEALQRKLLSLHDWTVLEENKRNAQLAYEEALGSALLVA